jgi:hypothetical protein
MPVYFYFIVISFLVSFPLFRQTQTPFYLKLFSPFLGLTLLVDGYGLYLRSKGINNYTMYSLFTALEFVFYLFVLSCIIRNLRVRLLVRYILVFNIFFSLISMFYIQKDRFNSISYSLSCLLIVFFCIYYFFEIFRYPQFVNLKNEPSFWICSGLLFYYCCSFPLLGLTTLLETIPRVLVDNIFILLNAMNILLYTLFVIAFLCRIKTQKR